MKKLLLFLSCAGLAFGASAQKTCTSNGGNDWNTAFTCVGSGQPIVYIIQSGDSVNVNLTHTDAIDSLIIYGTLHFQDSKKVDIDTNGIVQVYTGGKVVGGNNRSKFRMAGTVNVNGPFNVNGPAWTEGYDFQFGAVPVNWLSFDGQYENNQLSLQWSTATEINNDYFNVELSQDLDQWMTVGTVKSNVPDGNSMEIQYYEWKSDMKASGAFYVRLAQVDFNGDTDYSSIVRLTDEQHDQTVVLEPKAGQSLTVRSLDQSPVSFEVYNLQGAVLYTSGQFEEAHSWFASVPGVYTVRVQQGDAVHFSKVILYP